MIFHFTLKSLNFFDKSHVEEYLQAGLLIFVTKIIGDNYRIYDLIIILNVEIVTIVRCRLFKMSNVNHLTILLPMGTHDAVRDVFLPLHEILAFMWHENDYMRFPYPHSTPLVDESKLCS